VLRLWELLCCAASNYPLPGLQVEDRLLHDCLLTLAASKPPLIPLRISSNSLIISLRHHCRPPRWRIRLISPSSPRSRIQPIDCDPSFVAVNQAIAFLCQKHESRVQASETFTSPIRSSYIRSLFIRFDDEVEIASRDLICSFDSHGQSGKSRLG
jgi:hypothetical protein